MASSSLSAIEKELECPICCETMTSPKIVGECLHSFCRNCISDYFKKRANAASRYFLCPICRKTCRLSKKGIDGLKDDFRAVSMICNVQEAMLKEALQVNTTESYRRISCHFCDLNGKSNKAKFVCDRCDLELCEECKDVHLRETPDSDHYVFVMCPKHWLRMKHYCVDCNVVICIQCWRDGHAVYCSPSVHYKDIQNHLLRQPAEQCEKVDEYHNTSMKDKIGLLEFYVSSVNRTRVTYTQDIQNESKDKLEPIESEISSIRFKLERLQSRLSELETEKANLETISEARVNEVEKYCGEYVAQFESIKEDYSATTKELDVTRLEIQELQQSRCLGPKHLERVTICKEAIDSIVSSHGRINTSIYRLGVCRMPKHSSESTWTKLSSAFSKLNFL